MASATGAGNLQRENDIFPLEVKSGTNKAGKSLKKYKELFPDQVKLRIRFSLDNLKLDDDVLNIPLFMADQTDRLIGLALEQRERAGEIRKMTEVADGGLAGNAQREAERGGI